MTDLPLGGIFFAVTVCSLALLLTLRLISADRSFILEGFLLVLGRASFIAAVGAMFFSMIQRFAIGDNWVVTFASSLSVAMIGGLIVHQLFMLALSVAEDRYGPKQGPDHV